MQNELDPSLADDSLDTLAKQVLKECFEFGLLEIREDGLVYKTKLGEVTTNWRAYVDQKKLS